MIVDDHHFKIGKLWRFNLKPQQKVDQKKNLYFRNMKHGHCPVLSVGFIRNPVYNRYRHPYY